MNAARRGNFKWATGAPRPRGIAARMRTWPTQAMCAVLGASGVVLLAAVAADKPATSALVVIDETGHEHQLEAEQLAELPRHQVTVDDRDGVSHTWEGPLVGDVLAECGVALGADLRGARLMLYLVAEGADGYRVLFALAEVDPTGSESPTLLADRRDGAALSARDGPYRIVLPKDKRRGRWVRNVERLVIAKAPDPVPAGSTYGGP